MQSEGHSGKLVRSFYEVIKILTQKPDEIAQSTEKYYLRTQMDKYYIIFKKTCTLGVVGNVILNKDDLFQKQNTVQYSKTIFDAFPP